MISRNKKMALTFLILIGIFAIMTSYNLITNRSSGKTLNNDTSGISESGFEAEFITNFWQKNFFVDVNGLAKKVMGAREMNTVVRLDNGYLNRNQTIGPLSDEEVATYADNTLEFQRNLEELGIKYVWATLPLVVDKYDPQMPIGVDNEHGNNNLDKLTNAFYVRGVNAIDLRELLHTEGKTTYDIFYKTDHHWTTLGGFWAYNQIVKYVEAVCDVKVDDTIKDINNYEIINYPESHLGSNGIRTGRFYAGVDDFDLIVPKFDTYIQRHGSDKGGTMPEMMYNLSAFDNEDLYTRYTYDSVLGNSLDYWHNPNAKCDLKVMIIGDSMAKAVMPFLAMSFSDVAFGIENDEVFYADSELMDDFNPDIVISMNYVWSLSEKCFCWGLNAESN